MEYGRVRYGSVHHERFCVGRFGRFCCWWSFSSLQVGLLFVTVVDFAPCQGRHPFSSCLSSLPSSTLMRLGMVRPTSNRPSDNLSFPSLVLLFLDSSLVVVLYSYITFPNLHTIVSATDSMLVRLETFRVSFSPVSPTIAMTVVTVIGMIVRRR